MALGVRALHRASWQVVVLAQNEAGSLGHNYIGTEHILLGLLREWDGVAARVLDGLGITIQEVRGQVARIVGQGDEIATGQIPFTPRAKKVLELSIREALALGHNYIGTEHLLLALIRENDGVAIQIPAGSRRRRRENRERGHRPALSGKEPAGAMAPPRGRRRASTYSVRQAISPASPLLAGWLLFGISLGIGVLIGWLMWG